MRYAAWVLAFAVTAPSAWAGEVTVTVAPGRITLAATATPVSDVLDQLARKTGMKVIYDGAPPRLLVSPRVERETASQAVLAVLEGLGLGYVLITDPTASRVETLFIASGVGAKAPTPAAAKPGTPGADEPQQKPRPPIDDEDEEDSVRPVQQQPEPPKPPLPQQPPGPYPLSPFAPQGPQPFIPGVTPQPGVPPGQPFIPGLTPPPTPPPQ